MPSAIPVNLGDIAPSSFDNLPYDTYRGEVDILKYREATDTAQPKLQITMVVIDGAHVGRKSTQFQSLSDKSYGFVRAFFDKFGFDPADYDETFLDYDEDTMEITGAAADILGSIVDFKVFARGKKRGTDEDFVVTEITNVVETTVGGSAPAPKAEAEPEPEEPAEAEAEEVEQPRAAAPVRRAAPAKEAARPQRRTLR